MSLIVASHADVVGEAEIQDAEIVVTGNCMRRKGFSYVSPPPLPQRSQVGVSPLLSSEEVAALPPEAAVLKAAQELGFGIAARREHPIGNAAGGTYVKSPHGIKQPKLSPRERAYRAALEGPKGQKGHFTVAGIAQVGFTTEGCGAESFRALYGSPLLAVQADYLPEDLNLVVTHDVRSDPSFIAASRRWSGCMEKATGARATEPDNVPNQLLASEVRATGPVSAAERAQEVKVAIADAHCQYSSGLAQTSVALRRRFAAHLAGPYEGLLVSILQARARASRKAQSILAGAGR
ncbi:MAG: hypothetical protein ACYCXW_05195 [Solirubrobacteraceae bacterium]